MFASLLSLTLALVLSGGLVFAQDEPRPSAPAEAPAPHSWHLLPRDVEETLQLTDGQRQQLKRIESDVLGRLEQILNVGQLENFRAHRPPPEGSGNEEKRPPAQPSAAVERVEGAGEASSIAAVRPLAPGVTRFPVVFSGGHETVPVDHGRPVVLIAAALGVRPEVFREAFSQVHPAGPGSGGPSDAEARANKAALMRALGPLGVTNDRLNTVSNFYRYPPGSRALWKNLSAAANALVKDGAIVGYEIISGGYGYTTPPALTVPGWAGATAKVEITFGENLERNGIVSSIEVHHP